MLRGPRRSTSASTERLDGHEPGRPFPVRSHTSGSHRPCAGRSTGSGPRDEGVRTPRNVPLRSIDRASGEYDRATRGPPSKNGSTGTRRRCAVASPLSHGFGQAAYDGTGANPDLRKSPTPHGSVGPVAEPTHVAHHLARECRASPGIGQQVRTLRCCIDLYEIKAPLTRRSPAALAGGPGGPSSDGRRPVEDLHSSKTSEGSALRTSRSYSGREAGHLFHRPATARGIPGTCAGSPGQAASGRRIEPGDPAQNPGVDKLSDRRKRSPPRHTSSTARRARDGLAQ